MDQNKNKRFECFLDLNAIGLIHVSISAVHVVPNAIQTAILEHAINFT